jgi:hypothetical protein
MNKKLIYLIAFLIIIGTIYLVVNSHNNKPNISVLTPNLNINPDTLAGIQTGNAPWAPEIANLQARLSQIGLPALTAEGTVLHTHQHLDIFINGKPVEVPANAGIDDAKGFISPIHTHDTTGITHVESPAMQKFYLGQFFDILGVKLTQNCISGYCADNKNNLEIFVNGTLYQGDPRQIELLAHQEIVITYGTILQLPFPMPKGFDFPAGY